jgi:hypothetical protein
MITDPGRCSSIIKEGGDHAFLGLGAVNYDVWHCVAVQDGYSGYGIGRIAMSKRPGIASDQDAQNN